MSSIPISNRDLEFKQQGKFNIFWASNPIPQPREVNVRVCPSARAQGSNSVADGIAELQFFYKLELTTQSWSLADEIKALDALDQVLLDRLQAESCDRRAVRRRRSLEDIQRRDLEVVSYSSANRDAYKGDCPLTAANAVSCRNYDGSLTIGYTGRGSSVQAAETAALQLISEDMTQGDLYLNAMNAALTDSPTSIAKIAYLGTTFAASNGASIATIQASPGMSVTERSEMGLSDSGGLSPLGKGFLPIVGILMVAALATAMLSIYRRRQRLRHKNSRVIVLDEVNDELFFDERDSLSSRSSFFKGESTLSEIESDFDETVGDETFEEKESVVGDENFEEKESVVGDESLEEKEYVVEPIKRSNRSSSYPDDESRGIGAVQERPIAVARRSPPRKAAPRAVRSKPIRPADVDPIYPSLLETNLALPDCCPGSNLAGSLVEPVIFEYAEKVRLNTWGAADEELGKAADDWSQRSFDSQTPATHVYVLPSSSGRVSTGPSLSHVGTTRQVLDTQGKLRGTIEL